MKNSRFNSANGALAFSEKQNKYKTLNHQKSKERTDIDFSFGPGEIHVGTTGQDSDKKARDILITGGSMIVGGTVIIASVVPIIRHAIKSKNKEIQ